jgi:hypothetical protein
MPHLSRLLYASSARIPVDQAVLDEILSVSRRNNAAANISGALLYADGNFIRYLEGAESAFSALFDTIARDTRHTSAMVLTRGSIDRRLFPDWEMGYRPLSDAERRELGRFDLSRAGIDERFAGDTEGLVLTMMQQFYRANHPHAVA